MILSSARFSSLSTSASDRIDKVNSLIARFPERSEYTINTSEFQLVKNRLISITNARSTGGRGGVGPSEADSKRPTLKKRQPGAPEGGDTTAPEAESKPADRPTLRKSGESSSKPPNP